MISNEMFLAIESDIGKKLQADRPLRAWVEKNGADAVKTVPDAIMAAIMAAVYHSMDGSELIANLRKIEAAAWTAVRAADVHNDCELSAWDRAAAQSRLDLPMPSPPTGSGR